MFFKWLKLTSIYFLLYFLSLKAFVSNISHLSNSQGGFYFGLLLAYVICSVSFFIFCIFKNKKVVRSDTHAQIEVSQRKVKNTFRMLIGLCVIIFMGGIINKTFWVVGPIILGIPFILYSGSVFLVNRQQLGGRKFPIILIFSAIVIFAIYVTTHLADNLMSF